MMRLYKMLSALLDYPDQALFENLSEIEHSLADLENASDEDKQALNGFLDWAKNLSLIELQENYVKTFDLTPDNALYLTHHLFEEQDRERGPTLITLSEYFKHEGYVIDGGELPDYLPLVLEFVSTLEDELSARLFLKESAHVAEIIARNLEKIRSPYAPLLRIVERHGRLSELAA